MSYVVNDPNGFKDEMIDGLTAAYSRYLRRIPQTAGVASVAAPVQGRVSTIVGGGSGHYPSFAGLVGPGFADAAVCGDIFSSPSAEQVYRTIRAVDGGAGVVMLFGNYQGDKMHFGLAAEQARTAAGIDARIVLITDDIASSDDPVKRRGIAGDFFVFRAAASAAWRGDSLDEVVGVAERANDRTRTIGVAFDGCTLPGGSAPLFTVDDGMMEIGLGIHGEPGIASMARAGADELGKLLVERLLAERPDDAARARILVNGLGRVKYEELFVLYTAVAREFEQAGVQLTEPEVGEFVTSLDMAGCSVTVIWTDDELEQLLSTPAATPGFVRPGPVPALDEPPRPLAATVADFASASSGNGTELTTGGRAARRVIAAMSERIHADAEHLGALDAVAADGDHGIGMVRGFDGAVAAAEEAGPDAAAVLTAAGMAFADAAGGSSGALWGSGLTTIATQLAADERGADCPDAATMAEAFAAALAAIQRLGGAQVGDKTMVDAFDPFVCAFAAASDNGASLADAWRSAAQEATAAAERSADLAAKRGRSAWLSERSVGTPDPGAVSFAAAMTVAADALAEADVRS